MALIYRKGDKGRVIADMQRVLRLEADGIFGQKTYDAVVAFQKSNGLAADGIAGPLTLNALGVHPVFGIDVSDHQGAIDWPAVAAGGVRFAYIKATEGQTFIAKSAYANVAAARAAGIKVGVYHFATPSPTAQDAEGEALHFWQISTTLGRLDLPPVLDIESNPKGMSPAAMAEWITRWSAVTATKWGRRPIVYTYTSFLPSLGTGAFTDLPLWLARYTADNDPGRTAPWQTWTLWQYGTAADVQGVNGKCDHNWLAGGSAALCNLCEWK